MPKNITFTREVRKPVNLPSKRELPKIGETNKSALNALREQLILIRIYRVCVCEMWVKSKHTASGILKKAKINQRFQVENIKK